MAELIEFLILFFILGAVWGMAFAGWFISFRIKQGKLPKVLKSNKEKLLTLLKEN